jgi:uncharacterized membrane protein
MRIIDTSTGNSVLVGGFPGGAEVDGLAFTTGGTPPDIPWLTEDPISGTVTADASLIVDLNFDASVVTQTGHYSGSLIVDNDTPYGKFDIPVMLHVVDVSYGVELSPPTDTQSGAAGTTVTYTLQVHNTGTVPDTFDLDLSGNAWPTTLSDSSISLGADEGAEVYVWVDLPAGAAGNDEDSVSVSAASQSDPSATDTSTLTSSVSPMYGLTLTPATDSRSTPPGSDVSYTLTVTNTGNISDSYDVDISGHAWTTNAPAQIGPLMAGESTAFNVEVTVPSTAVDGETDTATVVVTSQSDAGVSEAAVLTTEVILTKIYLPVIQH